MLAENEALVREVEGRLKQMERELAASRAYAQEIEIRARQAEAALEQQDGQGMPASRDEHVKTLENNKQLIQMLKDELEKSLAKEKNLIAQN